VGRLADLAFWRRREVKKTFDFLFVQFSGAILRRLDALEAQGVEIMGVAEEILGKAGQAVTLLNEERAQSQAIRAELILLRDQLPQEGGLSATEAQEVLTALTSIVDMIPATVEPVPPIEAPPVGE
jgi:hypothetical protein